MSVNNLEISKLNINNTSYNIKDTEARAGVQQALNKETTSAQAIQGPIQFQKEITLANGAKISVDGQKVIFS